MSFMQPEIVHCHFQVINNTNEGDIACPESDSMYRGNEDAAKAYGVSVEDVETVLGWGYRLQAPGYLDSTEWGVADTEAEAIRELLDDAWRTDDNADWIPELVERLLELAETDDERKSIVQEYGDPDVLHGPDDGDYIISDCGELGSKTRISQYGKIVFEGYMDSGGADKLIEERMERDQFWPNVWMLSDHGNYHLMTRPE